MFKLIIDSQEVDLTTLADPYTLHGRLLQNGKPQPRNSAIDTFRPGATLVYRAQETDELECRVLLLPNFVALYHSYGSLGLALIQHTVAAMVSCWCFAEGVEDISTLQRSLSTVIGELQAVAIVPCQAMSDYATGDDPQDRFDEMLFLPRVTDSTNQWSLMGRTTHGGAQAWTLMAEFGDSREADFAHAILEKLIAIRDALPTDVERAMDLIGAMLNHSYEICRVPVLEPTDGPAVTGKEIRSWLATVFQSSAATELDSYLKLEVAISRLRQLDFSPREIQRIVRHFPLYQSLTQKPLWS